MHDEYLLQNDYICKDHAISINKSLYEQYLLSKDGIDPDKIEKVQSYLSKSKVSDHKELVEFFISDSILALTYITDFLSPTIRSTLFTNSFCGGIYRNLYIWTLRKEAVENIYREKVINDYKRFRDLLLQKLESHAWNMLRTTYLSETANMFYNNAIETHTEGQTYQNFIKGFYILDDDLQNNTCQFYLALERYKMNIGDLINDRIEKPAAENKYYQPIEYFKWPKQG